MSIVRGIRYISGKYTRNSVPLPDTEEKIEPCIVIETQDDGIEEDIVSDNFPEAINLFAKIIPHKDFPNISAERIKNSASLGKYAVYEPKCATQAHPFCSKISLQFENLGEYMLDDSWHKFFKTTFMKYKLKFQHENNVIFEKEFPMHRENITENISTRNSSNTDEPRVYTTYPYCGFYSYGVHPREIEAHVFQLTESDRHTSINTWALSAFKARFGFDATADKTSGSTQFIGAKNFSASQKVSLYDELCCGNCTITLSDSTKEETYKSNSLFQISGTDLIQINFIKE